MFLYVIAYRNKPQLPGIGTSRTTVSLLYRTAEMLRDWANPTYILGELDSIGNV